MIKGSKEAILQVKLWLVVLLTYHINFCNIIKRKVNPAEFEGVFDGSVHQFVDIFSALQFVVV